MSGWWSQTACRDADPEMFVTEGQLSVGNRAALALCDGCAVRVDCRDAMRGGRRKSSIIAGGWRWTMDGTAIPHPDDLDLLDADPPQDEPAPPPRDVPVRSARRRPAASVDRFLAAGRAFTAGGQVEAVCARFAISRPRVYAARLVLREVPDLVPSLLSGALTISDAERAARVARAARRAASRLSSGAANLTAAIDGRGAQ
jgi:hypothetical protein